MRISARIVSVRQRLFALIASLGILFLFAVPQQALAQTPSVNPAAATPERVSIDEYRTIAADPNVPRDQHSLTQIVVIDVLSSVICQLTGIDPAMPSQGCLSINPLSGKIGVAQNIAATQFGANNQAKPQIGGAMGLMANMISTMYIPTVSARQYTDDLASNFGIVKPAMAQQAAAPAPENCAASPIGYGACGLKPIFKLWTITRDLSYALLVLAFVFLGIGVMTRFKADPRTVMTLQNQIPRVVIAIMLITFSYAIAGLMIDLMWTVTYTGVNLISEGATTVNCKAPPGKQARSVAGVANQNLINQPLSFTDAIYDKNCADAGAGMYTVAKQVSDAFGSLILTTLNSLFGWDTQTGCSIGNFSPEDCLKGIMVTVTGWIVMLIIIVAILVALFRLWFQLVKIYITTLIFIILGPIWIVMGLIPGRPMGFEKWLRLIFANLAAYPLVAFVLVFGRVMVDAIPATVSPQSVFIPPLVGNPNVAAFSVFIGFGAIMVAPNIPEMIRERMKVPQGKLGSNVAAGLGAAAGIATSPATRAWKQLNRKNPTTGLPEGTLSVMRHRALGAIPGVKGSRFNRYQRSHAEPEQSKRQANRARRAKANAGTAPGGETP